MDALHWTTLMTSFWAPQQDYSGFTLSILLSSTRCTILLYMYTTVYHSISQCIVDVQQKLFSPLQSQPESYPPSVLRLQTAVSFHRHSPQEPSTVYQQYLTDSLPSWKTKTEL